MFVSDFFVLITHLKRSVTRNVFFGCSQSIFILDNSFFSCYLKSYSRTSMFSFVIPFQRLVGGVLPGEGRRLAESSSGLPFYALHGGRCYFLGPLRVFFGFQRPRAVCA